MKLKYTPGTEEGLVGKTFDVEIIATEVAKAKHISHPLLLSVLIKFEDGTTQWISGSKLYDSTDMVSPAIIKRTL